MAASKYFVNQSIDIEISITIDGAPMTTGAPGCTIEALKPDKSAVTWLADVDNVGSKLTYHATPEDIDQAGPWFLQPIVILAGSPSQVVPGNIVAMTVSKRFT
jgi:hypothetical protein